MTLTKSTFDHNSNTSYGYKNSNHKCSLHCIL